MPAAEGEPPDPSRAPWDDPRGMRVAYRARLLELNREFIAIARDVAESVTPVNAGLMRGDRRVIEQMRGRRGEIASRCERLEDDCFVLIAREGPVASDLREVVAIIRAITDLERASKLLLHIPLSLRRVHPPAMAPTVRSALDHLGQASRTIFWGGVVAWRERDGLAVNELEELDDEVDRLQDELLADLYRGAGHPVEDVVALALLGRYYERLADHGVALAAHVAWAVTGDRVPTHR